MPATVRRRWSLAEVKALIDANLIKTPRYELVDGELLVTPSPIGPHQKAVRELVIELGNYLRQNPLAEVLDSPFDVELEPETIVWPDVFVVPPDEAIRLETEMPARSLVLRLATVSSEADNCRLELSVDLLSQSGAACASPVATLPSSLDTRPYDSYG